MTPVIPCSISNALLFHGSVYTTKKKNCLTKCNLLRKATKQPLPLQRFALPASSSVGLFPQYRRVCALHSKSRIHILSATGTDVAVEAADSPVVDENPEKASEIPTNAVETSEESVKLDASSPAAQPKRIRNVRKSEMPPLTNEELVPGATFTGKVRSIQPFGAFVDFGAFTDGLVHVSNLSDTFVKEVGSVVSIGQEVKVRLLEANTETGRISLTMRENDDNREQRKDASSRSDKPRPPRKSGPRKDDAKKVSKFVKGQDLEGTVKNLARAGAFITLPEGEEGFLPTSEEADDGLGSMMGGTSLEIGQEVSVRVLRISRGQVTLTMKKEEDIQMSDSQVTQGVVYVATNPFKLAFRENKDIASFLDEREKIQKAAETPVTSAEETVSEASDIVEVPDETVINGEGRATALSEADETTEVAEASSEVADIGIEIANDHENQESGVSSSAVETIEKEAEASSEILAPEDSVSTEEQIIEEAPASAVESVAESPTGEVKESEDDDAVITDEVKIETSAAESEIPSAAPVDDVEPVPNQIESITSSESQVVEEVVDNQVDNIEEEKPIQTPAAETEIPSASQVEDEKTVSAPDENGSAANTNGQTAIPSPVESVTTDATSPALVKQLRDETGAGMMDCKKALSETGGDIVKAQEFLRKKGLSSAEKKASRVTAEGRIGSYIHDNRIGVLVEINCETDFVSRGEIFTELVDDLAMQVAAYPQVEYLVPEDVPAEIVNKEREIEMQKEDLLSRPEQIRSKIVDGRIKKRLEEVSLLEQPYIKNDKVAVKDWVKQTIATIGENIKVKRFVRFTLGEGLEKRSQDFAAEVAAQTAAKPVPAPTSTPGIKQPDAVDSKETVQKLPAVTISAALVKKLREETGAGMMDCKKALSETEGDLEKAQEYLRKKGLSAADKKSSRIAAEGRIGSYIHDSRIGVLIEVNCETDFVGRSEKFKELVNDLAMQVVACPLVQYVSTEDIPESIVKKEKVIEMQREDLASKPENIREKIVEGRITKRLGELALLEQPFIKNDSLLVKDLVKQTVAALGENIKVRRFVRFTLGESTDKEENKPEA